MDLMLDFNDNNIFRRFVFMVPVPTFDKLLFWFQLLTSYGSASLCLDHKKQKKVFFFLILPFYKVTFFARKKMVSFIKFIVKCE
jgi:hypothetical protein